MDQVTRGLRFCSCSNRSRSLLVASIIIAIHFSAACSSEPKNANVKAPSASNKNAAAIAENRDAGSPTTTVDIKDPDRFTVTMTIGAQEINADPAKMPTLQFNLSQFDADRRWAFSLPALGQVVYLEKSGLRYLVLSDRKQYTELGANDIGIQLGRELTPSTVANQLKARAQVEMLGVEPVNGRTARKYRFKKTGDELQADGAIYVDIETGLPVRVEVNMHPASTNGLRLIVETRDIQLNPDRTLFDVPAGMKKISPAEAKQQLDAFASTVKSFVATLSGSPAPSAIALPSANKNVARSRR